jgi:hypothetical protein
MIPPETNTTICYNIVIEFESVVTIGADRDPAVLQSSSITSKDQVGVTTGSSVNAEPQTELGRPEFRRVV